MLSRSLPQALTRISPPSLAKSSALKTIDAPLDLRAANDNAPDDALRKTLKAMASLALVLAPQVSQAATTEVAVDRAIIQESSSRLDRLKENVEEFKDSLDPHGYLSEKTGKVGDYDLSFKPMDFDLKPRLKSGKPALKFRGELMETSLSKSQDLEGDWTLRQGFNARLRAEATTYDETSLDLETGVFREYRGPLGEDFQVTFRSEAGLRHRFMGENEGLRAGVSFRQELEGGSYQAFGADFKLYAEGRQSAYHNFDSGETELSYQFMAGPRKNFDLSVFGRKATISVTIGPELKGSTDGKAFELGVESKVRARF